MSGEFYLNYKKKRLDQMKQKNHQSKKIMKNCSDYAERKGKRRRKEDNYQK